MQRVARDDIPIRAVSALDVSVSHADIVLDVPPAPVGVSPLAAALSALAASDHVSLCTPTGSLKATP